MLQSCGKEIFRYSRVFILVGLPFLFACKDTASRSGNEEAYYIADYEAPADKWGFIDRHGNQVIRPVFDDVAAFSEGMAAVNEGGRWGYCTSTGDMVIRPKFRSAAAFSCQRARVADFNGQEFYIDKAGNAIPADNWQATDDFSEGVAKIRRGEAFGYVDTSGRIVIEPIYMRCWSFKGKVAVAEYGDKLGVIDTAGGEVLAFRYDKIRVFDKAGIILCREGEEAIAYTLNGKEIARKSHIQMLETDGNLVSIRQEGNSYFYEIWRDRIIEAPAYSNIIYLGAHRWAGKTIDGGYLILDEQGKPLSARLYDQINLFREGIAACSAAQRWGYIDTQGNALTPFDFGLAWDYKEGYARAAFTDGIAFIDHRQKVAFYPPAGTIDMRDFSEGLAPVQIRR